MVPRGDPASLISGCAWSECEWHMTTFLEQLHQLQAEATAEIKQSKTIAEVTAVDRDVLGGKGKLTALMRSSGFAQLRAAT